MLSGMRSLQEPWCYSGRRGWFSAEWRGNMLACPSPFQKEIQSSGSNSTTSAARPMTLESEEKVAVVSPQATSLEVQELKDQMARLTKQVAALATQKDSSGPSHSRFTTPRGHQVSYFCQQPGHLKRNCPHRRPPPICYACGQKGHIARDCKQENGKGAPGSGHGCPQMY